MMVPSSFYRRIIEIEERTLALPPRLLVAAGLMERVLDDIPDDERREVFRLADEAFDTRGRLDWSRLSPDERRYIHKRLRSADPD